MVALQSIETVLISPEGSLKSANPPSLLISCTDEPADLAIFAPPAGLSSTLCTNVPAGIFLRGRQLPSLMSAFGPDIT